MATLISAARSGTSASTMPSSSGFKTSARRSTRLATGKAISVAPAGPLLDHDVVLVVAALVADLEDVAKPFRRHKRGLGVCVRGSHSSPGRAVQHQRQSACIQAGLGQRHLDAVDDAFFRGGRRGQHLAVARRPSASKTISVNVPPISTESCAAARVSDMSSSGKSEFSER